MDSHVHGLIVPRQGAAGQREEGPSRGYVAVRAHVPRHLFQVAEALETELRSAMTTMISDERPNDSAKPPDDRSFVGIDGGDVRGRNQDWFEVIVGQKRALVPP